LVAILTAVVVYLKLEGAITESPASFHAFPATYTELLVNGIFKERVFNEFPFESIGGAELVFGSCVQSLGSGLEITPAKVAVTAHGKGMGAFDSRWAHHAICCTPAALDAFGRIELPYHLPGLQSSRKITAF